MVVSRLPIIVFQNEINTGSVPIFPKQPGRAGKTDKPLKYHQEGAKQKDANQPLHRSPLRSACELFIGKNTHLSCLTPNFS
jgi:hypothetical protein